MSDNDRRAFLSSEQQVSLQLFQEISQIDDDEVCIQILTEHSWNVDIAVDSFMQHQSGTVI
jgi:hypothetical protein